jgi:transposase InsO family protein
MMDYLKEENLVLRQQLGGGKLRFTDDPVHARAAGETDASPENVAAVRSHPVHSTACSNPFAERVIGSIRRECLEQVIVLDERHLRRLLGEYVERYHRWRCHRALDMDAPGHRPVQGPEHGDVVAVAEAGGLYRHYERRAA